MLTIIALMWMVISIVAIVASFICAIHNACIWADSYTNAGRKQGRRRFVWCVLSLLFFVHLFIVLYYYVN